nr:unnamed protein product [Callosobruchus chinensis]
MHSNYRLTEIKEFAFKGLRSLRILDLSQSSIKQLPTEGLQDLETLRIEGTPTMQTIPSIYDLKNLRAAKLTHSFHCCAFRYPAQHDPEKHAQYEENMKKICEELRKYKIGHKSTRKKRSVSKIRIYAGEMKLDTLKEYNPNWSSNAVHNRISQNYSKHGHWKNVEDEGTFSIESSEENLDEEGEDLGVFHSSPTEVNSTQTDPLCGRLTYQTPEVECMPDPNALNPCEDIMGVEWLRISVWCVVVLAIVGNLAVITVILFSESKINVSRFLICNLAFADLCMGLYLMLIASMDFHSAGEYFNFAYNWQYGLGCQLAGFLTVFSSNLSIFTLTVVTLERWYAITYAIHVTRRITKKSACAILMGGWIYSFIIAILPVFGVSNYSSTSICLPMEANNLVDKLYLYSIIFLNGLAFGLIVVCYVRIYFSLGYETRRANTKGEMTIAKKMALLIFIDFATVAPIAFFGLTALAGYPLIGVTRSKILLVFFYPLNACANPYLYALMTTQYRKDLFLLVSRCGICKKRAERYKLSDALPLATPLTNRSSGGITNNCEYSLNNCRRNQTYV